MGVARSSNGCFELPVSLFVCSLVAPAMNRHRKQNTSSQSTTTPEASGFARTGAERYGVEPI